MEGKPSIFRKEAREYYLHLRRQEGDVLHLAPEWTRWTYPVLMAMVIVAIVYCVVGTVSEYASGPALVRLERPPLSGESSAGPAGPSEQVATYVEAFLPSHYRPSLRAGMPLRVGVDGLQRPYSTLSIESVGDSVLGQDELRRLLGADVVESSRLNGTYVVVRARMHVPGLAEGMRARAEVAVRTESILLSLLPGLKARIPHDR